MQTRYVGTCPVCGRRQKVISGNLVHHGYQRPGYGHIVGDCFSVGRVPHEVSSETAEAYRAAMGSKIDELGKAVETAKVAPSLHYSYEVYEGGLSRRQKTVKWLSVERGAGPTTVDNRLIPSFKDVQAALLARLSEEIKWARGEAARMTALIDTWTEQPLTTVQEEKSRTSAEKEAAKKVRDDESAARKATAARAKAERERKLKAKIDAATVKARAFLDEVDPSDLKAVRQAYIKVLDIKLPAAVWTQEFVTHYLDRTELLKAAGLVRSHNQTFMAHSSEVERLIRES